MIPKYKFELAVPRPLGYSSASESPGVGEVELKCTDVLFQNCVGSPIAQLDRRLLPGSHRMNEESGIALASAMLNPRRFIANKNVVIFSREKTPKSALYAR